MAFRPCACASAFLPRCQLLLLLWLDNILSSLLSVNDFPQSAHVNGFSPRWLRSCRSNVACRANDLPHTLHLKFLSDNHKYESYHQHGYRRTVAMGQEMPLELGLLRERLVRSMTPLPAAVISVSLRSVHRGQVFRDEMLLKTPWA
jgi:hypothetical protein